MEQTDFINRRLKELIKKNLTNTELNIDNRNFELLAMTCFWVKENFSCICRYYGRKYFCYYNNSVNDIVIEKD